MTARSRRTFLKLGAVTAAGAAVAPGYDGAFVAWVKDPRAGEIAVLVGDRELTVRDRPLAKRLAQAAARAQQ